MQGPSASAARSAPTPASGESESFDTWHAVVKTFTYRVIVTTIDFGANYFVIGSLATAAGLSGLSLVAGPIAYFTHELAWHYFGPISSRNSNPLEATVRVPISRPGAGRPGRAIAFREHQGEPGFGEDSYLRGRDRGVGVWRQLFFYRQCHRRRGLDRLQHCDRSPCLFRT